MNLIVLDFYKNIAYIYTIKDKPLDGEVEDILIESGHNPNNCQWMITKNKVITKNK